jgi:hypothetical protein
MWRLLLVGGIVVSLALIRSLTPEESLAQSGSLTSQVACSASSVPVGGTLTCTLTLRNTGGGSLTGLHAAAYQGECGPQGPCIIGVIGTLRDLDFVSAQPPWSHRSNQYSNPVWEPLGSGTLAAGASSHITLTLQSFASIPPGQRNPRQLVCGGGSALVGGSRVPSTPISGDNCIEVRVGGPSQPNTSTPPPLPTRPPPTAAGPVDTATSPAKATATTTATSSPTPTSTATRTVTPTMTPIEESGRSKSGAGMNAGLAAGLVVGSIVVAGGGATLYWRLRRS